MLVKTILVGKGPVHPVNAAPWFELVTGWLRKNDFFFETPNVEKETPNGKGHSAFGSLCARDAIPEFIGCAQDYLAGRAGGRQILCEQRKLFFFFI